MHTMPIEQAEGHLAEIIEQLAPGEELILTRDGIPVATTRKLRPLGTLAAVTYARPTGLGAEFKAAASPWRAAAGMASALIASVVLLGAGGVYVAALACAVALAFGAFATRLTGGMTGDLYGATIEITEAAVLLFIAALAHRGWIDAFALGS